MIMMMIKAMGNKVVKMVVSVRAVSALSGEPANDSAVKPIMPGVLKITIVIARLEASTMTFAILVIGDQLFLRSRYISRMISASRVRLIHGTKRKKASENMGIVNHSPSTGKLIPRNCG